MLAKPIFDEDLINLTLKKSHQNTELKNNLQSSYLVNQIKKTYQRESFRLGISVHVASSVPLFANDRHL